MLPACDRFWNLDVRAYGAPTITLGCVDSALHRLTGLTGSLRAPGSGEFPGHFVNLRAGALGGLTLARRPDGHATQLSFSRTWVGPKPSTDTVEGLVTLDSQTLIAISRQCGGSDPTLIQVERPR